MKRRRLVSRMEAASGAQALRTLDANPEIDLLFSDIGLPGGMNGKELGQEALLYLDALSLGARTAAREQAVARLLQAV